MWTPESITIEAMLAPMRADLERLAAKFDFKLNFQSDVFLGIRADYGRSRICTPKPGSVPKRLAHCAQSRFPAATDGPSLPRPITSILRSYFCEKYK